MLFRVTFVSQFGGKIQDADLEAPTRSDVLEEAFCFFQDREEGPSMCTGDILTIELVTAAYKRILPCTYLVKGIGFERVSQDRVKELKAMNRMDRHLVALV